MATRGRKLLLGCGGGCLALIALSIGACVSFTVWINQPGEILEPTRLLGQDTTGFVEWSLRIEDPGTAAFVEGLMNLQERAQERHRRGPAWLNQLLANYQRKNRAQAARELLPAVVAWTLSPGKENDTDLHLVAVNLKAMGNRARFLDLMLRYSLGLSHSTQHADERIYTDDEIGAMFLRDSSIFVTNSEANARLAVDRMRGDIWETNRDPTEFELRIGALTEERPLRGAIGNQRGELWRIWKNVAALDAGATPPVIWGQLRGATLSGGFTGQTAFEAAIDFQGPDADWALANRDQLLALVRSDLGDGQLPVEFEAEALGDSIRVSLRVEDLFAFLDEM